MSGRLPYSAKIFSLAGILVLLILLVAGSCTQPFNLVESLDGPDGIPLTISPGTAQVAIDTSISLSAAGGIPPYQYSLISGTGSVDSLTGLYTAPSSAGTAVVQAADSYGATAVADIEVIFGTGISALAISPSTIGIYTGGSVSFAASGGTPPYSYTVSAGIGNVDPGTGFYQAPGSTGSATITVTDSAVPSNTDSASVTVSDIQTNVDYEASLLTDTSASHAGADPLSGEFTVTNIGSADGTKQVSYDVFLSAGDAVYSADDVLIDTGTLPAPLASSDSAVVPFSGTWPSSAGTYYFIVKVYASDDIDVLSNNTASSGSIALTDPPPADVDYRVAAASMPSGGIGVLTGDSLSESFTIENIGLDSGGSTIYWTAYVSANSTLEIGTDTVIDSGTAGYLGGGGVSGNIMISGTWPQISGIYFLIINLSAADDANPANDATTSALDWAVLDPLGISPSGATVNVGGEIIFTGNGGAAPYEFYIQTADSGTPVIDLNTGVYTAGNIPTLTGDVIEIRDSAVPYNSMTATVTVTDIITNVDYGNVIVTNLGPTIGGESLNGEFTFTNNGTVNGSQPVDYEVYISTDFSIGTGDTLVDNGTTAALNAGQSSAAVPFTGTWPLVGGPCNLIVKVTATDDVSTADNIGSTSAAVSDPAIDYRVTPSSISTMNNPAPGGSDIGETFTISNSGSTGGNAAVYWTAYISSDTVLDYSADDQPVDAGQISALGAVGTSASISIDSGSWPVIVSAVDYYLFVDVSASDEPALYQGNNNEYAAFSLTVPDIDYQVVSVSAANTPADTGSGIIESFTFQNTGSTDGSADVSWTAYISDDQVLDGSDIIIDAGQESSLPAGNTSGAVPFSGSWAVSAGLHYLIVKVSSVDETDLSNNYGVSTFFEINSTVAEPDYTVIELSRDFTTVTTDSAISETFSLRNSGSADGVSPVSWNLFASDDAVFGGDTWIGSGTTQELLSGASRYDIPVMADWAAGPGEYYLFLEVSAPDETMETSNNLGSAGPFTVYDPPDYSVSFDPSVVNIGQVNTPIPGAPSFTISNTLSNGGHNPIAWRVYLSGDGTLSGDDIQIDGGTEAALAGSGSTQVFFAGTLPMAGGFYNLIVTIDADDDENLVNNQEGSIPIAVGDQIFVESEPNDGLPPPSWDPNSYTGITINSGTTVAYAGTMDTFNGYDMFSIRTGPGVAELSFFVQWKTGYDDIDLYIYADNGAEIFASEEISLDSEPATRLDLTGFSGNTDYYIGVNSWLENGMTGSAGEPYSLIISVP